MKRDSPARPEGLARGRDDVAALGPGLALLGCDVNESPTLALADLSKRVRPGQGAGFRLLCSLQEAVQVLRDATPRRFGLSLDLLDRRGRGVA